ncbi:MFS transporter [Streptacidiphilus sp. EB129]|uniref:MFS transporter n=1 Tax=Streptacidiphilus sp. EB129 TaxID=3156262 RepID=UPI003510DAD0
MPSSTGATTHRTRTATTTDSTAVSLATEADAAEETPTAQPFVVPGDDDPDERTAPSAPRSGGTSRSTTRSSTARTTGAGTTGTRTNSGRRGMFSALGNRNYRYFFIGQVVSNSGTWVQRIAQDWLVLSLTGSAFAVGVTTAMQFLPMLLFGLFGGVLADRFPKRQLLIATQAAMGLLAAGLAALTLSGHVQVWHIYAFAFLLGMVTVVDNPTRQTFVVEMVGKKDLGNAVSLNAANFQTARLIGPAVAGGLMAAVGSGYAFAVNAVSFGAVILGLLAMRGAELHRTPRLPREKGQLRAGLHYVAGRPDLVWPIVLVGFIGTFGFNFATILSAFAYSVFHVGPGLYGLLNTAMAVGSLVGALLAARRSRPRLRLLVGAALAFAVLESTAALAPSYWVFAALLTLVGLFGLTLNTAANSLVQLRTDPAMRGRVMSLFMMVFAGGTPLGAPLVGWITEQYGPRIGLLACGLVSGFAAATIGFVLARIGNLRVRLDLQRGPEHQLVAFVPRQQVRQERDIEVAAAA